MKTLLLLSLLIAPASQAQEDPMRFGLAFAYPNQILEQVKPAERAKVWPLLDTVSVNILAPKAAELAREARTHGVKTIRTHSFAGWNYALGPNKSGVKAPHPDLDGAAGTSLTEARSRGARDVIAARQIGAQAHEANIEAGFGRGKCRARDANGVATKWHVNPLYAQLHEAYLDGRESELAKPGKPVDLVDLSFLSAADYYPNTPALSARWKASRSARAVMAYGTEDAAGEGVNLAYYQRTIARAVELNPGLPIHLYAGVGRRSGRSVIGSDEALLALVKRAPPGLAEIVGYVGGGAEDQLTIGHADFAPIVQLWPELRAAAS